MKGILKELLLAFLVVLLLKCGGNQKLAKGKKKKRRDKERGRNREGEMVKNNHEMGFSGHNLFLRIRQTNKHKKRNAKTCIPTSLRFCRDLALGWASETRNTFKRTAIQICKPPNHAVVFDPGVFLLFHRSIMLPGLLSKVGCAASEARKHHFFVFRGVPPQTRYRSRCARHPASSWGTMLKTRLSKTVFGFGGHSPLSGFMWVWG